MKLLSNIARGFSEELFWKTYNKAKYSKGIFKDVYTFLYMRMANKSGGYIGRVTTLLGPLHLPHGFHGIHISRFCTIGDNCTIFQNTTIGNWGGELHVLEIMY